MELDLAGKKIWVAGETGLVGQALLKRLETESCEILHAPHSVLDLTRQQETEDWISDNKPDVIFLAAAKVGGIGANSQYPADFLSINLAIAQNVIQAACKNKVSKLLYLGSSCIYPKHADQPICEDALLTGALEPTNEAYAVAKIAGLKLCQYFRRQYGCDFTSAMPTNLYGPGDRFDEHSAHVIPALILKMHRAKMEDLRHVEIWGTGKALREFLYIEDLADGLIFILKNYSKDDPVNIGSGAEISIYDLVYLIKDIVGYNGEVVFNMDYPDGTPCKLLDCSKLHALGWSCKTDLQSGLKKTYEWFLSHEWI